LKRKKDEKVNSSRPLFRTYHLTQAVHCLGLTTWKKDDKPQAVRCLGLAT